MKTIENNIQKEITTLALRLVGQPRRIHPADSEDHCVGCSPETGFDCSGLVVNILNEVGLVVPREIRHAREFFDHYGILIHSDFQNPVHREADLVFFSWKGTMPNHMGIMINEIEYIHVPGNSPVVIVSKLKEKDIPSSTSQDRPYTKNPIGFKRIVIR